MLPDIVSTYSDFMVEQVGREYPLDIQIAENCTLAERREMRGGDKRESERQKRETGEAGQQEGRKGREILKTK